MAKKKEKHSEEEEKIIRAEEKLKAFGIIKDPDDEDIEIDGDKATGGKGHTVDTHWPTTGIV